MKTCAWDDIPCLAALTDCAPRDKGPEGPCKGESSGEREDSHKHLPLPTEIHHPSLWLLLLLRMYHWDCCRTRRWPLRVLLTTDVLVASGCLILEGAFMGGYFMKLVRLWVESEGNHEKESDPFGQLRDWELNQPSRRPRVLPWVTPNTY